MFTQNFMSEILKSKNNSKTDNEVALIANRTFQSDKLERKKLKNFGNSFIEISSRDKDLTVKI